MRIMQIHSCEQSKSFFSGDFELVFSRFEPITNPDGSLRKGWDLIFYSPSRDQVFIVLDYLDYPWKIRSYSLSEHLGITQIAPVQFPLSLRIYERTCPGTRSYQTIVHHLKRYVFGRDNLKPGTVLDCACGTGYGTNTILHRDDITRAVGVDISEEATSFSRMLVKDTRANFYTSLPDETFDNIVCLETLEHVPDPYQFIQNLIQLLAPGGRFVLSVPSERWHGSHLNPDHKSNWNHKRISGFLSSRFSDVAIHFQGLSLAGPDTFSASEIRSESWGGCRDEFFVAILKEPKPSQRSRVVVSQRGTLRQAMWSTLVVERAKTQNSDDDVVVVTDKTEVFANNPDADIVLAAVWPGEVTIDLDSVSATNRPDHMPKIYEQRTGLKQVPSKPRLYLSEDDVNLAERIKTDNSKHMIVCHAVGHPPCHSWPERFWADLIQRLSSRYLIVLMGGNRDLNLSMPGVLSLVGKGLSWSQTGAILQESDLFICTEESDLSCVAEVMETPVIILRGMCTTAAEPQLGKKPVVVRSPFECKRCVLDESLLSVLPVCPLAADGSVCMEAITVEMVIKAVNEALVL